MPVKIKVTTIPVILRGHKTVETFNFPPVTVAYHAPVQGMHDYRLRIHYYEPEGPDNILQLEGVVDIVEGLSMLDQAATNHGDAYWVAKNQAAEISNRT